ncbi:MAG: rhodanese-like domain-containing protein [Thermoplasmata archaeon]|nr:MAG: rhodanese-like domain-containing protein [Thermoplasmata archaeon]
MELTIDVRTREEFVKEHIKRAINIPWQDLDFYIDFLKGKEIMLYCDTGNRANIARKTCKVWDRCNCNSG